MLTMMKVNTQMMLIGLPMIEFIDQKRLVESSLEIDNDFNHNGKNLVLYEGLGRKFLALKNRMIDVTNIEDVKNYVLYKGDHVKKLLSSR
jgi:hypothetical protein